MNKLIVLVALFVAATTAQTYVTPGVTYSASTPFRAWTYFSLPLSELTINYVQLATTVATGTPFFYANIGSYPTFQNNMWKNETVNGGSSTQYIWRLNFNVGNGTFGTGTLYIGIYGYSSTKYNITFNTQGPIVLTNRQASTPSFPVQNSWVFYKLTIDPSVLSFQAVVNQNIQFYMTNKTSIYPTSYTPSTLNSNSVYVPPFGYYSCLQINYPYPGTYHLGLIQSSQNYTIQFVENGLGKCSKYYS